MAQLIAHRGAHAVHPENTIPAFEEAIAQRADGVELDVRTSRDGEVVVCHDPTLDRVAGSPLEVARVPWSRLREVPVGATRLPRLDEVLDLALGAGLAVNVEVKGDVPDRRATASAVGALLMRRGAAEREAIFLSSFHPTVLGALARSAPPVRRGFLFDLEHTGRWRAEMIRRAWRPAGLHPHHALCTEASLARWRAEGRYVAAWTVNEPETARRLAALGVDMIITDDVPGVRRALAAP